MRDPVPYGLSLQEYLEAYAFPEPNSGCWIWMGPVRTPSHPGFLYGVIGLGRYRGRSLKAQRAAWEIYRGPISNGLHVLHKCDVPLCINPDHLFLGTHTDNMRDAEKKGRIPHFNGENHHSVKLSVEQVRQIRAMRDAGIPAAKIAAQFPVSRGTVQAIGQRKIWTHV